MHTDGGRLHLFAAFINNQQFDVNLHWTTWAPGEGSTEINHEAVTIPAEDNDPALYDRIIHQTHPPGHETISTTESENGSNDAIFPADEQQQAQQGDHNSDSGYSSAQGEA